MSDANLIQGARLLAKAKTGVNAGLAFKAGMDEADQKFAAQQKQKNKQDAAAAKLLGKANDAAFKILEEFTVASASAGQLQNFLPEEQEAFANTLRGFADRNKEASDMMKMAVVNGDNDMKLQATKLESDLMADYNKLIKTKTAQQAVRAQIQLDQNSYLDDNAQNPTVAKIPYNDKVSENNSKYLTVNGFDDDPLGAKVMKFATNDIDDDFLGYAGKEFEKYTEKKSVGANTENVLTQNMLSRLVKNDGLDEARIQLLLSEDKFKSLNAGFGDINVDELGYQGAAEEIARRSAKAIVGQVKSNEAPTGNWTDSLNNEGRRQLDAYNIQAPLIKLTADEQWRLVDAKGNPLTPNAKGVVPPGVKYIKETKTGSDPFTWDGVTEVSVKDQARAFLAASGN